MKHIEIGARVRVLPCADRFPEGHPLAGAKGTVVLHEAGQYTFDDYPGYVGVRLETDTAPIPLETGSELMLRAEDLELIQF